MRYCKNCHYPLEDTMKFCHNCGAKNEQEEQLGTSCPNCGAQLAAGTMFCMNCGASVGQQQAQQYSQEPVQEVIYTAPADKPRKKGKGGLIALILVLVLALVGGGAGFLFGLFGNDPVIELDGKTASRQDKDDRDEEEEEDRDEDEEEDRDEETAPEESAAAAETAATEPAQTEPEIRSVDLTVMIPEQDIQWLLAMYERFCAEHPEYNLSITVDYAGENDAASWILTDVAGGADLYMFTNDRIGELVNAGALAALPTQYSSQVSRDNSRTMQNSVTYYGNVYGFPYSANTWFMYYDKSVFTEADVQSLETMLAKGKVAFPFCNGWYLGGIYAGAGATFFGSNGMDASAGIRLTNGAEVSLYLAQLLQQGQLVSDNYSWGVAEFGSGSGAAAAFSGSWDAGYARELLGSNLGVAAPPSFTLNGRECRITPFLGSKVIGVNPYSGNLSVAMEFAAYLASEEGQLERYRCSGTIPAALGLVDDPEVAADPVALAQLQTIANGTVIQPYIVQMRNYWDPMQMLGQMLTGGQVNASNVEEILAELEAAMNAG